MGWSPRRSARRPCSTRSTTSPRTSSTSRTSTSSRTRRWTPVRNKGAFVAGQIASEAPDAERLRRYDLLLTSFPHFVEEFRRLGVDSEYFRIGFDPRVLDRLGPVTPEREIAFVGALNASSASQWQPRPRPGREALADRVLRLRPSWPRPLVAREAPLPRRALGPRHVPGAGFVSHRSQPSHRRRAPICEQHAPLREHRCRRRCSLTDAKVNLSELFEPDREVIAYRDADDLVAACPPLPRRRRREAGDRGCRTGADSAGSHVCDVRMRELVEILEAHR